MIVSITSSLPSFKPVHLKAGLNLLVVATDPTATAGHTRNSAGKTSLVEIIHFLLGGDVSEDSIFLNPALSMHSFCGEFNFAGKKLIIERSAQDKSKFFVLHNEVPDFEKMLKTDKETEKLYFPQMAWRKILGSMTFNLPIEKKGSVFDEAGAPSFRSMVSYFARRKGDAGFEHVERYAEQQQRGDYQVNLSYMLGLDWQLAREFDTVRKREKTLKEVKKAAKDGIYGKVIGTVAELRPQTTLMNNHVARVKIKLDAFSVLDSYETLSSKASKYKTRLQAIANELVSLQEYRDYLNEAIQEEETSTTTDLKSMYDAAGLQVPEMALKRYDEVATFHRSIIQNRRIHLTTQLQEIKERIEYLDGEGKQLDTARAEILMRLKGQGALDDFIELQSDLAKLESEAATLNSRLKAAEIIEGESTQLGIDRKNLLQRLQQDLKERKETIEEATLYASGIISKLYDDRTGFLIIEPTDNGPEFKIYIEGDRGGGISNMEIFCFDFLLLHRTLAQFGGHKIIVHDSHLFDGVDPRQISNALVFASEYSKASGLPYLVLMNSDMYESLIGDFKDYVLPVGMSDKTEIGGLFGLRF